MLASASRYGVAFRKPPELSQRAPEAGDVFLCHSIPLGVLGIARYLEGSEPDGGLGRPALSEARSESGETRGRTPAHRPVVGAPRGRGPRWRDGLPQAERARGRQSRIGRASGSSKFAFPRERGGRSIRRKIQRYSRPSTQAPLVRNGLEDHRRRILRLEAREVPGIEDQIGTRDATRSALAFSTSGSIGVMDGFSPVRRKTCAGAEWRAIS